MNTDWLAVTVPGSGRVDIVPVEDLIDHDTVGDCVCGPSAQMLDSDRWLVAHASLDHRGVTL